MEWAVTQNYLQAHFDLLANKLRMDRGKKVEVYGVPELTSGSLIQAASEFIPIGGELLLR
jgi:uncharacterized LabA/DUF88 family protein